MYSNLGVDEELYTNASDSLTLQEYFTQVMGFSEEKIGYMSCTAMFIQLLNDLRNSISTCSPGLVTADGSSSDYTQHGERDAAFTDRTGTSVAGVEHTYSERVIGNLKSHLVQSPSGLYDGLSRVSAVIEGIFESGQWQTGGSPSIGSESGESSVSDIQEGLSDIGDDPTGIAAYLLYVTRDFIKHVSLQSTGIRSALKSYISVTDNTTIEEIHTAVFGDTGGESGKRILGYGLETTEGASGQPETAIYSDIIMQSWSSEMKSSESTNPVNYLPFDRYSLITADSAYLPAIQIFINHMLTESGTSGSTLLNPRRFVAFSNRISKKISNITTYVKNIILARGASEYNSAKLFEICVKKFQGVLESRYTGSGEEINKTDLTRMFILLLAEKDEDVDNALLDFLLIRSTFKRKWSSGTGYPTAEGKENDTSLLGSDERFRAGVASITDDSITWSDLETAYYTAAATLANAVRESAAFGALHSSGGTVPAGTEIFDDLAIVKRTFSSADPFREGGIDIGEDDSSALQNDLEYDSIIRAIAYDHGEGNDLFDILWVCVNAFQSAIMNRYQTLSGFDSPIENGDILTYQSDEINRYGRETAVYIFFKKFLSETIRITFNRGVDNEYNEEPSGADAHGDNEPAYYTFREGVFIFLSNVILESYESIDSVSQNLDYWESEWLGGGEGQIEGDRSELLSAATDRASYLGSIYSSLVNEDAKCINLLHYLNSISDEMASASNQVQTMVGLLPTPGFNVSDDVLAFLKQHPQGQNMLLTLTRDSLMTSKYLHKGFQDHRQYDYQVAIKNFDAEQISNMVQALSNDLSSYLPNVGIQYDFVPSASQDRKKILVVGIPAGVAEYLRYKGAWLGNDSRYLDSTYLKITVYRRNLQDDSETSIPKEFYFDMSSYLLEGLAGVDDSASLRSDDQSVTHIFANMLSAMTIFDPLIFDDIGSPSTFETDLIKWDGESVSLSPSGEIVLQNHFFDYYLKMYLRIVLGIDVFEDSFPFNESETISSTCDADKQEIFNSFEEGLVTLYASSDELAEDSQELEFNKTRSVIAQSTIFSSIKYRNRVLFSRIFDRVFCIYVDIDDFELESGEADTSESVPSFYQLYTTYEIVPAIGDAPDRSGSEEQGM